MSYNYGTTPNYGKIEVKDHFGFSGAHAANGTGAYKTKSYSKIVGGVAGWNSSIAPEGRTQLLTIYHYYNGGMAFYVPIGPEPRFPTDFCKVAVVQTRFDDVLKQTESVDGSWSTSSIVQRLFVCCY